MTKETPEAPSYTADDFSALEGLEAVVRRPGMYVGSSDSKGLTHLVYEIFDNSVDEALAGHCTRIEVTMHPDGSIEVSDNGRGIPVDLNSKTGKSGVLMAYTMLHAGGKFGGSGYGASGGLHGVGAAVTTALSKRVDVSVCRAGEEHRISFVDLGKPVLFDGPEAGATSKAIKDVQKVGAAPKGHTGTRVRFWPNLDLFVPGSAIERESIVERARKTAFLVPNLAVQVRDLRADNAYEETFQFDGGIKDMVDYLTPGKAISDIVSITGSGLFTENVPKLDDNGNMINQEVERDVQVRVAFRWDAGYDTTVQSFVNVVSTPGGGTHVKGFERGMLNAIRKGYEGTRLIRASDDPPLLEDMTEGLTAVVYVSLSEPQFQGQTKEILGTQAVLKITQDVVTEGFKNWIEGRQKAQARLVLEKIANAAKNRVASRTQREAARRKTALEGASMPAKLVDCRAIGVERSELFIVEGDSALGSARMGRNSEYQALLPIRGKILNVQKASLSDMLNNAECASIIQCIGAGSGRSFDIDQMRYGRVMIMADADVDGGHIRSLLLTLIWRYMRPIIEEGRLYAAMPPLHKIEVVGRTKETIYTYSAAEMEETISRLEKAGKKVKTPVQRYKGLGEMNSEELWETTMDPASRSVRKVTAADAAAAELMIELLMGNDVESRRNYIIENADLVDRTAIDA